MIQPEQIEGMDLLAPVSSPAFTGAPKGPTPMQSESDTTRLATVGFVRAAVAASGGGSGGSASLYVTDDDAGNIELTAVNTSSSLTVTDDNAGNIQLTLT